MEGAGNIERNERNKGISSGRGRKRNINFTIRDPVDGPVGGGRGVVNKRPILLGYGHYFPFCQVSSLHIYRLMQTFHINGLSSIKLTTKGFLSQRIS